MKKRYAIGAAVGLTALAFGARKMSRTWGSTPAERLRPRPGDELLPTAQVVADHGITIWGSPHQVWPWLVQLGQDKAGFYSFTGLENLVGLNIHNAGVIVPQWQQLAVGDPVYLAADMPLSVAELVEAESLVLFGSNPQEMPFESTWSFYLDDQGDGTTRLVTRERYHCLNLAGRLIAEVVRPVACFMTWGMLRGIQLRAEDHGV